MSAAQKAALKAQLADLHKRLAAINRDLARPHSQDSSDQAQERENDETLEAIAAECQRSIDQIEVALEHIASGSYGTCAQCGQVISEERLQAVPETTLCVRCADQ